MKVKYRLSSSVSSINNLEIDQRQNIHIDLRSSSNKLIAPYDDLRVESTLSSFSKAESINDSTCLSSQRKGSQRRRTSHLIKKIPLITRECVNCLLDKPLNEYEECYSNECEHIERTVCDTCVYNTIKSLLDDVLNSNIYCPEPNCQSIFNFESIRYILKIKNNLKLFERYDRQLTHKHLEENDEFVWCAHNGCGSGQFHDMGIYSNPMVICIKCKQRTCAHHRSIWHFGMTCQEYDQSNLLSNDYYTKLWLKKHSKKCPKCQSFIEKISGCDHMTCKRCKHQFCWICLADYRYIHHYGLTQHMKHCIHYPIYRSSNHHYSTHRLSNCNIL